MAVKETKKAEPSSYSEESEEETREVEPVVSVKSKSMPAPARSGMGDAAPAGSGKPDASHVVPKGSPPPPPLPPSENDRRADSEETEEALRGPRARSLRPPRSPSPRAVGATPKSAALGKNRDGDTGHGGKGHGGKGYGGKGHGKEGREQCMHCWKPLPAFQSGRDQHTYWSQYCVEWQFRNIGYSKAEAQRAAEQLKQDRQDAYEANGGHVPFPDDPFYGEERSKNRGRAHAAHEDRGREVHRKRAHAAHGEAGRAPGSGRRERGLEQICPKRKDKTERTAPAAEEREILRVRETRPEKKYKEVTLKAAKKDKGDRKTEKAKVAYVLVKKPSKKRKQQKMVLVSSSPSPEVVRRRKRDSPDEDDDSDTPGDMVLERTGRGTYRVVRA